MKLAEIKIKAIRKGITMTELSEKIGVERRLMYMKIKKQDKEVIEKIKRIFKS